MATRRGRTIIWGWGSVADGLTWVLGAGVAVWKARGKGDLPPGWVVFVTGCLLGPAFRRALWGNVRARLRDVGDDTISPDKTRS